MVKSWFKAGLFASLACCVVPTIYADINAEVGNTRIQEGDIITLKLTDTDSSGDMPDLAPLQQNFDIYNVSTNSQMSIVNGKRTSLKQWDVPISPKKTGQVLIPPLRQGKFSTKAITLTVTKPDINQKVPQVNQPLIEASLDQSTVYQNGQALMRIRIKHRGNVSTNGLGFDQLEIPGVPSKQIDAFSYQRVIDDTPVVIFEFVLALNPEDVGYIEIPEIATTLTLGRSLFNSRQTRRTTQPLTLEVKPLPPEADNLDVVTAYNLVVSSKWSDKLDQLTVGDSITQTLTFVAKGAPSEAIPAVFSREINGLKQYPDQPVFEDTADKTGTTGIRKESTAFILTQAGEFTIPERKLYWVDAKTGELKTAIVPAARLKVAPGEASEITASPQAAEQNQEALQEATVAAPQALHKNPWFWSTAVLLVLWLITLVLYLTKKSAPVVKKAPRASKQTSNQQLFEILLQKCSENDAAATLSAFNTWGRKLGKGLNSNHEICQHIGLEVVENAIKQADSSCFDTNSTQTWSGSDLRKALIEWQKTHQNESGKNLPDLYP